MSRVRHSPAVMVVLVAVLLAAALVGRVLRDGPQTPVAPSTGTGVMTHPREGAMYHQPYTLTR